MNAALSPKSTVLTHSPIGAAAEGQMEKLLKQMASLWEKIQENQENLEAENSMTNRWRE